MIQINFKNMEKSNLARDLVLERIETIAQKFPDLKKSKVIVSLEMENSPFKPGPDLFTVKLHIKDGRYKGVTVSKSYTDLYRALAEVVEHMLERLNRFGDKARVKNIRQARKFRIKLFHDELNSLPIG